MATASSFPHPLKPPNYILQSWHREQIDSKAKYSPQQTLPIAPDGTIPLSRFRQRLRKIYEDRTRAITVVRHDPWVKSITPAKDLVKSHWKL